MRVSVVPGKLMLLMGYDTLKVLEARFDLENHIGICPGAGDLDGNVLRESPAGHSMVPLLPDLSWEFRDSFVPSETAGPLVFSTSVMSEVFSVKRLPGSRTIRDLMISFGQGSFQRLHQKELLSHVEEELMENVVTDSEGSLHWKPRECDVMDVEESPHQKPREVCNTEELRPPT